MSDPNETQSQIADMLSVVEGPSDPVEQPEDPTPVEQPAPEPVDPTPEPETQPVAEQPEPEPVDEIAALKAQIEELKAQVQKPAEEPAPDEPEPLIPESDLKFEVSQDDINEALYDPEKMFELVNKLVEHMSKQTEHVVQQVPKIVNATTARQAMLQQTVAQFRQEHPKLNAPEHRDYLAFTTQQVEAENPAWTPQQVLA